MIRQLAERALHEDAAFGRVDRREKLSGAGKSTSGSSAAASARLNSEKKVQRLRYRVRWLRERLVATVLSQPPAVGLVRSESK
jgi:hypothetical protein